MNGVYRRRAEYPGRRSLEAVLYPVAGGGWSVTDVDLDESIFDGQTGVVVTVTGTVAATGKKVWLEQSGNWQEQTVTAEAAQTITVTDGTTQTVTNMTRSAGTDVKTLVGTSTAGWNIAKQGGGKINLDYLALSYSAATANKFYAGDNSTDTVGNTGWVFGEPPTIKVSTTGNLLISTTGNCLIGS